MPALDPGHAVVDERGHAESLAFVRTLVDRLRDSEGTWHDFANHEGITVDDIVAYMADPDRFEGERRRWLGRPHFALLLTFLELLGQAREQLNGLTRRHLDFYYRDVLRMRLRTPVPDRVAVLVALGPGVDQARLPAGTALDAGRDPGGKERIYRTERELLVSRAAVASLRSVHVDRRIIGIPDVPGDRSLTAAQTLDRMLALALGRPRPGGEIPTWNDRAIDRRFLVELRGPLAFCREQLFLEHHELRALLRLVRRRRDADHEWAAINARLGVVNPSDPRDFARNLEAVVGVLDFRADGLPQVDDIDDLHAYRAEPDVRSYIATRLAAIGYDDFVALMSIKLRIDAEWAEINRLLARIGRLRLGRLAWELPGGDPTAFAVNLARALGEGEGAALDRWPPPWPLGTTSIEGYEAAIRSLEAHLALPVEPIERLAAFAEQLGASSEAERFDWSVAERLLAAAHRERIYGDRRAELAKLRDQTGGAASLGLDAVVAFVLDSDEPLVWEQARARLAEHLGRGQLDLLDELRRQLLDPTAARLLTWDDALRVLELAWRSREQLPEPVAVTREWRNLYAFEDARTVLAEPSAPRWKTFGAVPVASGAEPPAAAATLGWALCSPVLSLCEGTRTLTLTLGWAPAGFDRAALLRALGLVPEVMTQEDLREALHGALRVEASTDKGWIELPLAAPRLASGGVGDDYWTLVGTPRTTDVDRPALQLVLVAGAILDPLAPLATDVQRWPTLRVTLRQRRTEPMGPWRTALEPFESLVLAAVHCSVHVEGLTRLQLQHDDRPLDPAKPFEPFGRQPAVGSRFYLGHPELARARLDMLRFDIEWMGLPPEGLGPSYVNYPERTGGGSFSAAPSLVERGLAIPIGRELALFEDGQGGKTNATRSLAITDVPAALADGRPGFVYERWTEIDASRDLRAARRFLRWELGTPDFGHSEHPKLAMEKARALAIALAAGPVASAQAYAVGPPYTPTIKSLRVTYQTAIELDPTTPSVDDRLLHVHPFGVAPIDPHDPTFLPRYDQAGELYIGLRGVVAPQQLSLLVQLAEGTSEPTREAAPISWHCLDGDRWRDLADGGVLQDATRGLINSGIVELALPTVAPSTRLPGGLYWLRIAIPRGTQSVCDAIELRTQAVLARFEDHDDAPTHHEQPLPAGSIQRLRRPNAQIGRIEQPHISFGGRPTERLDAFHTRVSERLRHKQRALTAWDYERLVLDRFPSIYKVKCLPAVDDDEPGRVEVIVIPDLRHELGSASATAYSNVFSPKAAADVLADIQAYLAARAPAEAEIRVRNAEYVPVLVRLRVRFGSDQTPGFARQRLQDDLVRFLAPWAYDADAEPTLGGRIHATSIVDYVDRLDYVDFVGDLTLFRGNGRGDFTLVPPVAADYHVATERADQVLVAARQHFIEDIPALGYPQDSFTGIGNMRIELDFIVG